MRAYRVVLLILGLGVASAVLTTKEVAKANIALANASAAEIVEWAFEYFGTGLAVSTSFGMNAAATLSVTHKAASEVPVLWVDTGYLPRETQTFADELTLKMGLDVRKCLPKMSPSQMEDRYGKLWEMDSAQASKLYDMLRKVEPMVRCLRELNITAVIAGVQREQIPTGRTVKIVTIQNNVIKICPFVNWEQSDVDAYLRENDLGYHPLKDLYFSIGDLHSMKPVPPKPPVQKETCTQEEATPTSRFLYLALAVVLGALILAWFLRTCISPHKSGAKEASSPIPTPKLASEPSLEPIREQTTHALEPLGENSRQRLEPITERASNELGPSDSAHDRSYFSVSGATGALLLKELQSELQGEAGTKGADAKGPCHVAFAQKEFWEIEDRISALSPALQRKASRRPMLEVSNISPSKNPKRNVYLNSFTVSGAGAAHLAREVRQVLHRRHLLRHLVA
jgi:phosphoadenosine phosphosulfate reductase